MVGVAFAVSRLVSRCCGVGRILSRAILSRVGEPWFLHGLPISSRLVSHIVVFRVSHVPLLFSRKACRFFRCVGYPD